MGVFAIVKQVMTGSVKSQQMRNHMATKWTRKQTKLLLRNVLFVIEIEREGKQRSEVEDKEEAKERIK